MSFILRWFLVLVLLVQASLMLASAPIFDLIRAHAGIDLSLLKTAWAGLSHHADWIEAALWYAATVFLLIAVVRLVRRTQAFWMWLLAFALLGARWAVTMRAEEGGALGLLKSLTLERFYPIHLAADAPVLQLVLLAKLLILGLIIHAVDNADRSYWDRHGG